MIRSTHDMKASRFVLPPVATLERIGIAGRARRLAAQAVSDSLGETLRATLGNLLQNDPALGQSPLAWLRGWPQAKSVSGQDGILGQLEYVRGACTAVGAWGGHSSSQAIQVRAGLPSGGDRPHGRPPSFAVDAATSRPRFLWRSFGRGPKGRRSRCRAWHPSVWSDHRGSSALSFARTFPRVG